MTATPPVMVNKGPSKTHVRCATPGKTRFMGDYFKPMEPVSWPTPIDNPGFVHQVKWDGIRILARVGRGGVSLRTRRGGNRTENYPELHILAHLLRGKDVLLDGEAVVLDDEGRPSFGRILRRDQTRRANRVLQQSLPVYYVVFDLLFLSGESLMDRPFAERHQILSNLLTYEGPVALCTNHPEGAELFEATGRMGLEGIVSKELTGRYHPGRKHPTWRKVKHFRLINAVVGGILLKQGRANTLLLGLYDDRGLVYVGRAASGLSGQDLLVLTELARAHPAPDSPFAGSVRADTGRSLETVWLAARPTVMVRYTGWTEQARLRNPVIVGFSKLPAEECLFP